MGLCSDVEDNYLPWIVRSIRVDICVRYIHGKAENVQQTEPFSERGGGSRKWDASRRADLPSLRKYLNWTDTPCSVPSTAFHPQLRSLSPLRPLYMPTLHYPSSMNLHAQNSGATIPVR